MAQHPGTIHRGVKSGPQVNLRRAKKTRGVALQTIYGGTNDGVTGPPPERQKRNEGPKPPSKAMPATPAVSPNRKPSDRLFGGS